MSQNSSPFRPVSVVLEKNSSGILHMKFLHEFPADYFHLGYLHNISVFQLHDFELVKLSVTEEKIYIQEILILVALNIMSIV